MAGAFAGAMIYVGGTSESLGAGEQAWATLWNGSSETVRVFYIFAYSTSNVTNTAMALQRTTTRGTQTGATVTPDVDNHASHRMAIPTGVVLDLGYTAQPTFSTLDLSRPSGGVDRTGSGLVMYTFGPGDDEGIDDFVPIVVPASEGLAVSAVTVASSVALKVNFGFTVG